ncbi:MAG TPA: PAS domain-containing protein [Devosia sp.]|uniref:helix-turn-helix transcriptional regulator n=1 Tax=Devosia sp. TaxID=1871048 RepID=UPI002DDD04A2|nr:PAS domain-containing protein [Devosia sp.]HEV2515241.1 PAS domain-containing protein [Devosia sp.]
MLDIAEENYGALIHRVYSAGLDRDRWSEVLSDLSTLIGRSWIALHGHDMARNVNLGFLTHNYSPDHHASYLQHFAARNPWNTRAARVPVGSVIHSQILLEPGVLKRTEFYNDWIRPQEDIGTGAGVTLFRDRERFLRLSCNIRFRDLEHMEARLLGLLKAVGPHVQASFQLSRRLAGARIGQHYQDALQLVPEAVLLLDSTGRITFANAAAEQLLENTTAVATADGRLALPDQSAQQAIEAALAAITRRTVGPGAPITIRTGTTPLVAELFPFVSDETPVEPPLLLLLDGLPTAIMLLRRSTSPLGDALAGAAERFGWSPAETALCQHLLEGGSVRSFSERRSVSFHTARNQMRSVLEKAGVQRQSALVALVASLGSH